MKLPSDKFIEDLDVFLYVIHLDRLLCVEYREGRYRGTVINITASGLDKTANEDDFEEAIGIFKEFKLRTGLN